MQGVRPLLSAGVDSKKRAGVPALLGGGGPHEVMTKRRGKRERGAKRVPPHLRAEHVWRDPAPEGRGRRVVRSLLLCAARLRAGAAGAGGAGIGLHGLAAGAVGKGEGADGEGEEGEYFHGCSGVLWSRYGSGVFADGHEWEFGGADLFQEVYFGKGGGVAGFLGSPRFHKPPSLSCCAPQGSQRSTRAASQSAQPSMRAR